MADQTLTVKILGDERDLLRSLNSSSKGIQRFSVGIGTFVKGALVFEGVRAGVQGVTAALRAGIGEWSEQQKIAAQTAAAIRSTGGVANVTAKDIDRLGARIQNLSGIDDEAIKSGANLLLTFKNVRNELGKGNNVFDRATAAAVDLSVAGFGSIESTSKQLGKALNDPIKGMTALGRAGVTFTQKQRDQIKAMVESNRVLDAQKLILKEVESQVGGSAEALGDTLPEQLNKLKEAFRNAMGDVVGAVAGPLAKVAGDFAGFVPKIEQSVARLSAAVGPALGRLVDAFTSKLPQVQKLGASVLDPLREHVLPILQEVAGIVGKFWSNMVDTFSSRSGQLRQILDNLGQVLRNVWTVARPTIVFLFEKALPAALNIAIPLLEKLTGVARVLSEVFVQVVSKIVKALDVFLGGISKVADAASHLPGVGDSFAGIADKVNASRESLRAFTKQLDQIDGRKVSVSVAVDVTTGRREEGATGHDTTGPAAKKATEKATQDAVAGANAQKKGAGEVRKAASAATTVTKSAKSAAEKQREAFDSLMDTLSLRRERAARTPGLQDDIKKAQEAKRELEAQLKIQKGNVGLLRQLDQVNADLASFAAQKQQGRQFEALGLTAEGEKRGPGVQALKHRLGTIRDQLKGTALDTQKTRSQLAGVAKVLSGQFGAVGKEVRDAILAMFNEISGALKSGGKTSGSGSGVAKLPRAPNVSTLFKSFGFDPDTVRQLRREASRAFGLGRTGGGVPFGGAFGIGPAAVTAGGGAVVYNINGPISVTGDADAFIREIERRSQRTSVSRTGPSAGRRGGI